MSKENKGRELKFDSDEALVLDGGTSMAVTFYFKESKHFNDHGFTHHFIEYKAFEKCQAEKEALEQRLAEVESLLREGLKYMKAGKILFASTTTNSFVDYWIKDVEASLADGGKDDSE